MGHGQSDKTGNRQWDEQGREHERVGTSTVAMHARRRHGRHCRKAL